VSAGRPAIEREKSREGEDDMAVKLMPVAPVGTAPAAPAEPEQGEEKPKQPRKRRRAAVYDADGHEVLITLKCLKCARMHPLSNFGLRKMADGAIRNQPWCRDCRGASSPKKKKPETTDAVAPEVAELAEAIDQPVPAAEPPVPLLPPRLPSGQMQVVPLTAEQVLRALAPQPPQAPPAIVEMPEPAPSSEGEPKPE
jgi:hypothetical protein